MRKALLVDDSSFSVRRHKKVMNQLGIESTGASSGPDALAVLDTRAEDPFDFVLVDLLMAPMTGEEVVARIKQKYPTLPVIVVSADIQPARRQEVLDLGAAGFVNKPLSREKIEPLLTQLALVS